jgi:hypothetical protein
LAQGVAVEMEDYGRILEAWWKREAMDWGTARQGAWADEWK